MGVLFFESDENEIEVSEGESIIEACKENGVNFSCKDGLCGSCVIKVTQGQENLSPLTMEEEDFFGNPTLNERLACQCSLLKGKVHIRN